MTYNPRKKYIGGYHPRDGTMQFFNRVRSVLRVTDVVIDLGAGRGSWFFEDECEHRRRIRNLKPDVGLLWGLDVDPVVLENQTTHRNVVIKEGIFPIEDHSVDVIVSDYVLEHIKDVELFYSEVDRVLKSGGYFFARTPHSWNYVSIAARIIKNRRHSEVLRLVQPNRKSEDVFPTMYRLNTVYKIRSIFKNYDDYSYLYTAEPAYYFGSRIMYAIFEFLHWVMPRVFVANMFVMLQKK